MNGELQTASMKVRNGDEGSGEEYLFRNPDEVKGAALRRELSQPIPVAKDGSRIV